MRAIFLLLLILMAGDLNAQEYRSLQGSVELSARYMRTSHDYDYAAMGLGLSVRFIERRLIFLGELAADGELTPRNVADLVGSRFYNANLYLGKQVDLISTKLNFLVGLGLQLEKRRTLLGGIYGGYGSDSAFSVGVPLRTEWVLSKRRSATSLFAFVNLNSQTSSWGAGLSIPFWRW